MKKYLTDTQCQSRLEATFRARFTDEELSQAKFYTDREGDLEWTWRFDIGNFEHHLTIDRCNGEINHERFKHIKTFR